MSRRLAAQIAQRLGANGATLILISLVAFLLMSFKAPEDVARSVLGREISAIQIAKFVERNQLDRPLHTRYLTWIGGLMKGDLGKSIVTGRSVSSDAITRLGRSLILAGIAAVLGVGGGILVGVFLARRLGTRTDLRLVTLLLVLASMPEFLIGSSLYLVFVIWLVWFPTQSSMAFAFGGPGARAVTFVLPAVTIALLLMSQIARITRVVPFEALGTNYVDAAKLRGLSERKVLWQHAFRNAAVPLVSAIGTNLVCSISGVVVVDYLFGFPGIGALLVAAIGSGDAMTVQGIIMMFALIVVITNICVDLMLLWLNPRLRLATS